MSSEPNTDLEERNRIFYSAIVHAYIESSMEKDRSLLNLSAGGIGLLVTLLTTIGVHSKLELIAYVSAFLSYGTVIVLVLHVLGINRDYLVALAQDANPSEKKLKKFDRWIFVFFILALLLSFAVGFIAANNKIA